MTNLTRALTGISGILATPFDADGALAPERQAPIVERALAAGVHILTANGNTGEFYSLTTDEAVTMVQSAAGHIKGRCPLVAGVGRAIPDACRLAEASAQAGADALMIHQPPDPFVAPRGVVDYIKAVSDAAGGLPIGLAHGITLRNAVAKDRPVRWADVEIDETVQAVQVRREMEAMFTDPAAAAAQ